MINCVYGKATENLTKIIDIRLANNEKDYLKQKANQPLFSKRFSMKDLLLFMKLNQF